MTLRNKAIAFTFAVLAVSAFLAIGVSYYFRHIGSEIEGLSEELQEGVVFSELYGYIDEYASAVTGWATTGYPYYKVQYQQSLVKIRDKSRVMEGLVQESDLYESFMSEAEELIVQGANIIAIAPGQATTETYGVLNAFRMKQSSVSERIHGLHELWIRTKVERFAYNEASRITLQSNVLVLVSTCLVAIGFFLILMRRMLGEPYRDLLEATGRVAAGDLGYRIGATAERRDELGTIAGRFNVMVESLQRSDAVVRSKLRQMELLLEVARIAGVKSELGEALELIVKTVGEKLGVEVCGIYLPGAVKNSAVLRACTAGELVGVTAMRLDGEAAGMVLRGASPTVIGDIGAFEELRPFAGRSDVLLLVPIVREGESAGIFLLGKKGGEGFGGDEKDVAKILAYTIGNAVRNIELYEAAQRQLRQIGTVFELSKSLTSVFVPEEVLKTITGEVVKLIDAKGCVIRLLQDDMLTAVSYSGKMEELGEDVSLPVGAGIVGWAAREGRSILVEDIAELPAGMSAPVFARKSAIAVPLRREKVIIGTLGLYDKLGASGEAMSFSVEDLAIAEGFATISALAIDKMRMQERQKKTEAEILRANRRMELLFESVQGGIITLDSSYIITSANKYVQKWIDLPLEEIVSKSALEVFHGTGGICPHCVSKATFERGDINSITQARGLNYAELTAYPVHGEGGGEVNEAVVFIQDITERVLYQEEIMGLYREVMMTKEYIESLINNSADAIVTTDLEGVVKSWNPAAEQIYGFVRDETVGRFIPFVPDALMALEKDHFERIRRGEVINTETYRRRKDGAHIEVALTLSPIKNVAGEIIAISGISRDITEKKRVEKELIRRNQELSRLFFISSAMRGTLDLERLIRMVLTVVTMSDGLGFNRAVLFLYDEERRTLRGTMGVGPSSPEEAWRVWEQLSVVGRTLYDLLQDLMHGPLSRDSSLDRLAAGIEVSIDEDTPLARAVREKKMENVRDAIGAAGASDPALVGQLGTDAYALVPLVSMDNVIGVLWVDNQFNRKPITEDDMKFIAGFADQVASAIEAARLFQKVSLAEAELENIFRSISDMIYITDSDYTIKSANQAVLDRLGLGREEVVGAKCYKVFHGMDTPWKECPHHITVETLKANIMEVDDPYMGGAFLTSTSPVFNVENAFIGTVHVVRDISEIKQLREKLHTAERMAALGEVAAKVAHEIRNPLVSIGGFAKRLEAKLEGNMQEYARIIAVEVRRLEAILKDILGFVKEVRMTLRDTDLSSVVLDVAGLIKEELGERNNVLRLDLSETPVLAHVDPDRLKEALLNVLANANQATDGGTITVSVHAADARGVIGIEDTGCGIRKDDVGRIFNPFFTTRPTGTGLGLAIAKRIVEEHDGTIEVARTTPGEGTKFVVSIPLKEEHDEDTGG